MHFDPKNCKLKIGNDLRKLVSSANRLVKKDIAKGKSLHMRNSRGPTPRTLSWGTPQKMFFL